MQKAAVERAAAARGDTIEVWYTEKRSGKMLARPELDRLRADARAGRVERVYLFRLDRLTRSGIRDTFEAVEELRAAGTDIVTIADGFSLNGPAAEVILAVMAWAAKMERLAINERIAAARQDPGLGPPHPAQVRLSARQAGARDPDGAGAGRASGARLGRVVLARNKDALPGPERTGTVLVPITDRRNPGRCLGSPAGCCVTMR